MNDNIDIKLQSWLERRYSDLLEEFKDDKFRMPNAIELFKRKYKHNRDEVSAILSELRRAGRLKAKLDPDDNRRRIYQMVSKEKIITEQLSLTGKELTRSELENLLKKAADLIRTRVDYKFILVLLFLKRISDKWQDEYKKAYDKAIRDGLKEADAQKEAQSEIYHDFDMPEEYLWDNMRKDVAKLPEQFSKSLKIFAEKNPELKDVLDNVDFILFASSRENAEILRQLVELFSKKSLHNVSPDILGDAYEWILRYFAPTKAKEGEVYTPREVIKLLVEILKPEPKESIYDPASASNGMLIISYDYVKNIYSKEEANKLFLYGQEVNHKTLALGRMNLYIHDMRNAQLSRGDTLLHPKFKRNDGSGVKKFDIVIANPPWNQDGYDEETLKKGEFWKQRFNYGFTTKQSADWAWIQHMLASADDENGRVGIVIDNGSLFRSGREGKIRTSILEEDLIECIILLPEKLFYNTGAPGALIILKKKKEDHKKNKVLFINASKEYEKHPDVRKLNILSERNIAKIVATYNNFKNSDGFSREVSLSEIKENSYNLNVTLYVYPEEVVEEIDINKEWKELYDIEKEISKIEEKIEGYLKEIK